VGRHRHTPEIEQILTNVGSHSPSAKPVDVIFTPHLVPMDRGILATIYTTPTRSVTEHELLDIYRDFYRESPFMRVGGHLPATKDSAFSNFCDLTLRVVKGKILIIACLDNLLKGASGVAVQNFNLMTGQPETMGLF
jgi:N-acetyl-gamma-glutamyl-phosphate reductase